MIKCQICEHENPEGAEYCENCGASLASSAQPAASAPSAPAGSAAPDTSGTAAAPAPSVNEAPASTPETAGATEAPPPGEPAPPTTTPPGEPRPPTTLPPLPEASAPSPAPAGTPAPTATGGNARLVPHRYGAASPEEIPLLGESLVIGRFDPETGPVDIDLENTPESAQISRHHAEMYREADGTWYVRDLGSTNGVFIKRAGTRTFNPRITTPEAVNNGDEIAFGNARFVLRVD